MTWYYPSTKSAIESDILFDTTYTWGTVNSKTPSVMDLRNIATHEIGHLLGLGHTTVMDATMEATIAPCAPRSLPNGA